MTSRGGLSRHLPCGAGVGIAWLAGAVAYRKVSPCERFGEGLGREEGPAAHGRRTGELPVGRCSGWGCRAPNVGMRYQSG